jgi:hypothetical protein
MVEYDESLEQTGAAKEPDLKKIIKELQQANADAGMYADRVSNSRMWWLCEWPNQSVDGRKWPSFSEPEIFPWPGCSDSRLRIVSTIVQEHVALALTAFWTAKVQAKSIRPFVQGREVNITQRMLNWRVYTHMKRELLRELPLAFQWKYGLGLSFIGISWEQQRELAYVPITLDMIAQVQSDLGLGDIVSQILSPDGSDQEFLATRMQQMSQVLSKPEARKVLEELRSTGQSELPVVSMRVNKPKWTAKRPLIDVLFPSETTDIQQTRWENERELVSESELVDRIETDGYDPDFVDEALDHKGQFSDWMNPPQSGVSAYGQPQVAQGSDRDLVELNHFLYRTLHKGVPCLYHTTFNSAVAGGQYPKYAVHRKFEYDHQQIPLVALRRNHVYRPLLSSMGIAEEAYTDELDIKRQQDGLNNRTDVIHRPPMIVPTLRAQAVANQYGPGAVMTALRPNEVNWPPLPPFDQTPVLVMQFVLQRINRRYPTQNAEGVDPQMVSLYRQSLANDTNGELELALEQTLQLMQEFETDADVQRVAGGGQPWQYSRKDIQGMYEVTATVDMKMIDLEYAQIKMNLLAQMLPFKGQGAVFNMAANILDPDLADALAEDQISPAAMQKEKNEEYAAIGQIMGGIEPEFPMYANANLRLQTIQEIAMQPQFMQEIGQKPNSQKMLQTRVQNFQNQIQQYQTNPVIGRSLATQSFQPNQPASVASTPTQ